MEKEESQGWFNPSMKKKRSNRSKAASYIGVGMENLLPPEVTIDILSRLPAESVLQCKFVCKAWRSLLQDPSFPHMHLLSRLDDDHNAASASAFGRLGFIFLSWLPNSKGNKLLDKKKGYKLHYAEYDENPKQSHRTLFVRMNLHPPVNTHHIVGSCNGLICIAVNPYGGFDCDPIYICNPITRECLNLPKFNERYLRGYIMSGFGYHCSTNEYKVVRIYYLSGEPFGRVQVYTLGGGSGWRHKENISFSLLLHHDSPAVLANGALHWLDDEGKIVAFDLADEEFRLLPSPPCLLLYNEHKYWFQLRVLGGRLCVVHQNQGKSSDIWSLKKKKKNGNCDIKEPEYQFWSWSKEFSIKLKGMFVRENEPFSQLFALTKNCEVLFYNHTILSRYDLKTATLEKLLNMDKCFFLYFFEAIPHMNSFVSLKALGEEDTQIIGPAEGEE
ncbi:F-box domain [Macleaya cordata]|uniref:F-box domain n=1 Tax=Macleaya cordata TaxID=56857 RepID=A0A200R121_MACCD|nr:F-box domain [Macleaya cordata]